MIRLLLLVLVLFAIHPVWAATTLDQYRDIVVSPQASPTMQSAAKDLQYYLQKIGGRDLPIVGTTGAGGLHFFVGSGTVPEQDKAIADLPLEGWIIRSVDKGLLLAGNDKGPVKTATFDHSVPLFLEKYCGVRWLWPGESGEVVPHNPQMAIPDLNETGAPQFKRREMTAGYPRYWQPALKEQWREWVGHSLQGDQVNANFGHAWASVMPKAMYFEQHPEWYALVNGKREPKQLCISNPQLRDEFVKRLLSMPANQKLDIVSVSANDGTGFCECDLCKAKGSIGDSYWDFVNDIAQRVKKARPGLGIGTFAYTFGRQPPSKIDRLPDNIYLSMTSYATQLMLPDGLKEYQDFTDKTGMYTELVTHYGSIFTPEVVKEATGHLDEAERAAGNDASLKAKIDFLRVGCDYTRLMGELLSLYTKLGRTGFPLEAFEWEATAEARRKAVDSTNVTDGRDYFEQQLKEPFSYTLADKDAWLNRAWELGQQRIVMLRNNKKSFAIDEGLYANTVKNGMRQWQQTIGKYLGKSPDAIETLGDDEPKPEAPAPAAAPAAP